MQIKINCNTCSLGENVPQTNATIPHVLTDLEELEREDFFKAIEDSEVT
jgi:hypothetical protein